MAQTSLLLQMDPSESKLQYGEELFGRMERNALSGQQQERVEQAVIDQSVKPLVMLLFG